MDKQKKPSAVCDDLVTDSSILQGRGHYALLLNAKDVIIPSLTVEAIKKLAKGWNLNP